MRGIGYTARICENKDKINAFLNKTRIGVIAMTAEDYPYALPVNYVWHKGAVYFHGMGSGRKFEILTAESAVKVCFNVYEEIGTVTDPVPCHADTSYFSVVIFGRAIKVTDYSEAAEALNAIIDKYLPGKYKHPITGGTAERYRSSMDNNAVAVFRVEVDALTAKENSPDGKEIVI